MPSFPFLPKKLPLVLTTAFLFGMTAFQAQATPVPAQIYRKDAPKPPAVFPNFIRSHALPVEKTYPSPSKAERDVRKAFETAEKTQQNVLLTFGANWSADCSAYAGVLTLEELRAWVAQNFIIVPINVSPKEGKFYKKNMEIAKKYGVVVKALPTVLAFTPRRTLLNPDGTEAIGNAHDMKPQEIADLLNLWASRAPHAKELELQNAERAVRLEAAALKAKQLEEKQKKLLKKGETLGTTYYENGQLMQTQPRK